MKKLRLFVALVMAVSLFAAACGSSGGSSADTSTDSSSSSSDDSSSDESSSDSSPEDSASAAKEDTAKDEEAIEEVAEEAQGGDDAMAEGDDANSDSEAAAGASGDQPGAGVSVTMSRPTWNTENVNAEIYRQLLQELGYEVSDPADKALDPNAAFLDMAQGGSDFWVSSWMPGHQTWLSAEMTDGTKVSDKVSVVGEQLMGAGLQGYLITKSVAEEHGIKTMDQISEDPELNKLFDQDGDGQADMYGCPEGWTCDNIITEAICQAKWNITQLQAGYDAMFAEATSKVEAGEPAIIYTWSPSGYVTQLIPGDNVMWLSVDETVSDEKCSDFEGDGAELAQPNSVSALDETQCLFNDKGECNMGWTAADIRAAGSNEFLDQNPAAKKLIESVTIPVFDASQLNFELDQTEGSTPEVAAIASKWIEENRDTVDGWLSDARSAA